MQPWGARIRELLLSSNANFCPTQSWRSHFISQPYFPLTRLLSLTPFLRFLTGMFRLQIKFGSTSSPCATPSNLSLSWVLFSMTRDCKLVGTFYICAVNSAHFDRHITPTQCTHVQNLAGQYFCANDQLNPALLTPRHASFEPFHVNVYYPVLSAEAEAPNFL